MLTNPQSLIDEFLSDLNSFIGLSAEPSDISHDLWTAPHKAKDLPLGMGAVYVFSLSATIISQSGAGRVLKVGKAGSNSNPRFRYQHYNAGSAMSTLAGAIENNPLLWGYIGFSRGVIVGNWIRENTDRNNFYFKDEKLLALFEVYAKARLGPVFEGSLSSKV